MSVSNETNDEICLAMNPEILDKFQVRVFLVYFRCEKCGNVFKKFMQTRKEYSDGIFHIELKGGDLVCRKCAQAEYLQKINKNKREVLL